MVQVKALPVFLCVMGLLSGTLCSLTLKAEVGDKVTIWCQHDLTNTGHVFWFKHTSDSVPLPIGCKKFMIPDSLAACYFFPESERIVMSVHDKNTSLTITAVNVSDTGLYYCSYVELNQVNFSNSTSLHVKGSDSPAVFFMLTLGFAAAGDSDSVNYAALEFSKMKTRRTKRHDEKVDPCAVYSAVAQSKNQVASVGLWLWLCRLMLRQCWLKRMLALILFVLMMVWKECYVSSAVV
ncbi:putative immune-type receptor 12b precursor [Clarias magur]|uniref:Putative immune-type receptor 12b n=1 Tax=Clarias magur TaxID=1594786 RepID=A0A8J4WV14_CLAMG|nr:putative immune-type receptor 12b precursor [Clarias magur]